MQDGTAVAIKPKDHKVTVSRLDGSNSDGNYMAILEVR